jgi:hypothetical protein
VRFSIIVATYRHCEHLSLAGLSCFVVAVVLLHWLQPNLDPFDEAVSYYVHGVGGWLLTVGLQVLDGGESDDYKHAAADALAAAMPHAQRKTLKGQMTLVPAEVLAPVLKKFFHQS